MHFKKRILSGFQPRLPSGVIKSPALRKFPKLLQKHFTSLVQDAGPVLVDITKDAQFGTSDFSYTCTKIRSYKPVPETKENDLVQAAKLINAAKNPLIVWGQGVILGEAEEEFRAFVEKSGVPAAWTILGVSAIETSHPLNVGMVGMHGNYAPNLLTNECDFFLRSGCVLTIV